MSSTSGRSSWSCCASNYQLHLVCALPLACQNGARASVSVCQSGAAAGGLTGPDVGECQGAGVAADMSHVHAHVHVHVHVAPGVDSPGVC